MIKPKNFYGRENYELRYDKSFEKNCIILASYSNKDVKKCTTKEYFALLEHHNKQIKSQRREKSKKNLT